MTVFFTECSNSLLALTANEIRRFQVIKKCAVAFKREGALTDWMATAAPDILPVLGWLLNALNLPEL